MLVSVASSRSYRFSYDRKRKQTISFVAVCQAIELRRRRNDGKKRWQKDGSGATALPSRPCVCLPRRLNHHPKRVGERKSKGKARREILASVQVVDLRIIEFVTGKLVCLH